MAPAAGRLITLTLWPTGETRLLGRVDYHGAWVRWFGWLSRIVTPAGQPPAEGSRGILVVGQRTLPCRAWWLAGAELGFVAIRGVPFCHPGLARTRGSPAQPPLQP